MDRAAAGRLAADRDGGIWYTGNGNGTIGKLDPKSGEITVYRMPDPMARDPHTAPGVEVPAGQLTLRDLSTITDVFVNILRGTHHPDHGRAIEIGLCAGIRLDHRLESSRAVGMRIRDRPRRRLAFDGTPDSGKTSSGRGIACASRMTEAPATSPRVPRAM